MFRSTLLLIIAVFIAAVYALHHCPINQVYNSECANNCAATCANPSRPAGAICQGMCEPGCECAEGYVRQTAGGKCIDPADCPAN